MAEEDGNAESQAVPNYTIQVTHLELNGFQLTTLMAIYKDFENDLKLFS